jgi:hypothetical protein
MMVLSIHFQEQFDIIPNIENNIYAGKFRVLQVK